MPFEVFQKPASRTPRGNVQGPPKITVDKANNGRITVRLSSAVRHHLAPTSQKDSRGREELTLKVRFLVDREARRVAIERVPDITPDEEAYSVNGLTGGAYFSGWNLDEELGLLPGVYPAEPRVIPSSVADGTENFRGVLISLDDRQPHEQRKRLDKIAAQIEQIVAVRDEGITLIRS